MGVSAQSSTINMEEAEREVERRVVMMD